MHQLSTRNVITMFYKCVLIKIFKMLKKNIKSTISTVGVGEENLRIASSVSFRMTSAVSSHEGVTGQYILFPFPNFCPEGSDQLERCWEHSLRAQPLL